MDSLTLFTLFMAVFAYHVQLSYAILMNKNNNTVALSQALTNTDINSKEIRK